MSGVNCTRRNSSPSARATAFATQRLRDARHALEQDVAAHEQRAEDPLDRPLLADGDLRHLGHDPVAQALHQR